MNGNGHDSVHGIDVAAGSNELDEQDVSYGHVVPGGHGRYEDRLPRRAGSRSRAATAVAVAALFAAPACAAIPMTTGARHTTENTTYHHSIGRINITMDGGELTLRTGPAGHVGIHRILTWTRAKPDITEKWSGDTLTVTTHCSSQSDCDVNYTAALPAGTSVEAATGGGIITADGLAGTQSLRSNGGDIRIAGARGPITIATRGGTITGTGLTSDRAQVTSGGGPVTLAFTVAPGQVTATTKGGNISVAVPRTAAGASGYQVQASTGGGARRVQVAQDSSGQHLIKLQSGGGDLAISYSD